MRRQCHPHWLSSRDGDQVSEYIYHVIYTDAEGVVRSCDVDFASFEECENFVRDELHAVYWEIGI